MNIVIIPRGDHAVLFHIARFITAAPPAFENDPPIYIVVSNYYRK